MSNQLISVVIPTQHRNNGLLERAVNSCKVQGVDVETVVVSDVPDGKDWGEHPGVDKYITTRRKGYPPAVNIGHKAATGQFRYTLDDDCFIYPGAMDRLFSAMVSHPDPEKIFVYGDVQLEDRVHVTPDWHPHINDGHFKTSNTFLWHASHHPDCHFRHPKNLPYFFYDYDFCRQLERKGVIGIHVPVVVIKWIPSPGGITERARPYQQEIRDWINNVGRE